MTNCIICGKQASLLFETRDYRRPDDARKWPLYWCDECEFGRLDGEFTPQQIATFYPADYYTHGGVVKARRAPSFLGRLRLQLAWRLDRGAPLEPGEIALTKGGTMRFCDVGCGSGLQLKEFKNAGYSVIGVEPDPRARATAQKVGHALEGTAEHLPATVAESHFDVVLLSHVLEHCVDPLSALANARNILLPHGTLVVEVPNNAALGFWRFRGLWPWTDIPRHLNFFTERSLQASLRRSGFTVASVRYVGYSRQFHPDWIRTQDDIWRGIGGGRKPNFNFAAWSLLLRTLFAPSKTKYDSVRIHAVLSARNNEC